MTTRRGAEDDRVAAGILTKNRNMGKSTDGGNRAGDAVSALRTGIAYTDPTEGARFRPYQKRILVGSISESVCQDCVWTARLRCRFPRPTSARRRCDGWWTASQTCSQNRQGTHINLSEEAALDCPSQRRLQDDAVCGQYKPRPEITWGPRLAGFQCLNLDERLLPKRKAAAGGRLRERKEGCCPWYQCPRSEGSRCALYSVSIVSFGPEFGRPLPHLTLSKSHSVATRSPSRCFVIKSAGLIVPRIFSISGLLVFLFLLRQKNLVPMFLMPPLPPRRASPGAAAASVQVRTRASCPSSRIVLANPMAPLAHLTTLSCDSALPSDTTSCVDDVVARVR